MMNKAIIINNVLVKKNVERAGASRMQIRPWGGRIPARAMADAPLRIATKPKLSLKKRSVEVEDIVGKNIRKDIKSKMASPRQAGMDVVMASPRQAATAVVMASPRRDKVDVVTEYNSEDEFVDINRKPMVKRTAKPRAKYAAKLTVKPTAKPAVISAAKTPDYNSEDEFIDINRKPLVKRPARPPAKSAAKRSVKPARKSTVKPTANSTSKDKEKEENTCKKGKSYQLMEYKMAMSCLRNVVNAPLPALTPSIQPIFTTVSAPAPKSSPTPTPTPTLTHTTAATTSTTGPAAIFAPMQELMDEMFEDLKVPRIPATPDIVEDNNGEDEVYEHLKKKYRLFKDSIDTVARKVQTMESDYEVREQAILVKRKELTEKNKEVREAERKLREAEKKVRELRQAALADKKQLEEMVHEHNVRSEELETEKTCLKRKRERHRRILDISFSSQQ